MAEIIRGIITEKYKLKEIKIKYKDIRDFDFSFKINSLIDFKLIEEINYFKFQADNDF